MLGKLMKYELKACGRTFLPLYGAILLMSVIAGLSMNMGIFQISGLATIVLFGLFVALGVLTIMITIQRFRRNLLDDEGYLMFTLPVTSKELIFSKYSVALIYTILSSIVSVLSFIIIVLIQSIDSISFSDLWYDLSRSLSELSPVQDILIYTVILAFILYTIFILTLYLSVSMGQLPIFNKHRNIVAFISFFVINIVVGKLYELVSMLFRGSLEDYFVNISISESSDLNVLLSEFVNMIFIIFIYNIVIHVIFAVILFFGITYILDKKLNLE